MNNTQALGNLIHKGSVKDVYGEVGKSPYIFHFSDRYSIFDWGTMPDELENKGKSLALTADFIFSFISNPNAWKKWELPEYLSTDFRKKIEHSKALAQFREEGLPHHSFGLINEKQEKQATGTPTPYLAVNPVSILRPQETHVGGKLQMNYDVYKNRPQNALLPLEAIFRFGAPQGSSFLRRVKKNPSYAHDLGFSSIPKAGDWFPFPIVEFSTKLETTDRMLSSTDAQAIAGLSREEFSVLEDTVLLLALRLKTVFDSLNLELWDGKFEFAFTPEAKGSSQRRFQLVDSIGPDELRILKDGVHLSKEIIRQLYKGSAWEIAIEKAKEIAVQEQTTNWKQICIEKLGETPEPLSENIKEKVGLLYPSLTNALAKAFDYPLPFPQMPPIQELVSSLREITRS